MLSYFFALCYTMKITPKGIYRKGKQWQQKNKINTKEICDLKIR